MESQSHINTLPTPNPLNRRVARCPFHDGPLTLDGLLAELAPSETAALDAALDLRSAMAVGSDADQCVAHALRLRQALDGRHYLAFYRVRRWLMRMIEVQVRAWRGEPWQRYPLPLDCARLDEIENSCLARFAQAQGSTELADLAQLRFSFRTTRPIESVAVAA